MAEPRERIARALCEMQGHAPNIRFEGKPMWQSFLGEADAALAAADFASVLALLRQVIADAGSSRQLRAQAEAVLHGYLTGKRSTRGKSAR